MMVDDAPLPTVDSPLWFRVAGLVPRLRTSVRVRVREDVGGPTRLLTDTLTGRHHLVDADGWAFVGRLDGRASVAEIWSQLRRHHPRPPTQQDVLDWMAALDRGGLLQGARLPDLRGVLDEQEADRRRRRRERAQPLAWRVTWTDNRGVLVRLDPLGRLLFGRAAAWAWLAWLVLGAVLVAGHAAELGAALAARAADPGFVIAMALAWLPIKLLHELGHALAVRRFGGSATRFGIAFLYGLPSPFVDASAASVFASRRHRLIVTAAGIAVEVAIVVAAVVAWTLAGRGDGLLATVALAVIAAGGLSTLLANANPLVRMDGYHLVTDLAGLPNLALRSRRWWLEHLKGWLLRLPWAARPAATRAERVALPLYAPSAWVFAAAVSASITMWFASLAPTLALLTAAAAAWMLAVRPVVALGRWLAISPELEDRRMRCVAAVSALAALAVGAVLVVPLPRATVAHGVAWMPEEAIVRAPVDGFVAAVDVASDRTVRSGEPLLAIENDRLPLEHARVRAERIAAEIAADAALGSDPARAQRADAEVARLRAQENDLQRRIESLRVVARRDGHLTWVDPQALTGRPVKRGDVLGHVLADDRLVARVALPHSQAAALETGVRRVQALDVVAPGGAHEAVWDGLVPAATTRLPTPALSRAAGGPVQTDPADADSVQTLEPVVVIDVPVPSLPAQRLGSRLWLRFEHEPEPLATRLALGFRQAVLRHLGTAAVMPAAEERP